MARRTFWIDTRISQTVASGAQQRDSLMGSLVPAETLGMTTVRQIVDLSMVPPTAASDGQQSMFFAIGVVSQEAFISGTLPDPDSAADRPPRGWLYRGARIIRAAAAMTTSSPVHVFADMRGSRRVDDGELLMIFNNNALDGTAFSVLVEGMVRTVFLFP